MAGVGDIAREGGVKPEDVKGTIEGICKLLLKGEKITVHGLGTFKMKQRAARVRRNPHTGEELGMGDPKVVPFLEFNGDFKREYNETLNPLYQKKKEKNGKKDKKKDKKKSKK